MKKYFYIINIALFVAVLVGDIFYMLNGGLLLKALTSAGFVLIGLANLIYAILSKTENKSFCFVMFAGLVLGMLGDIFLEINFIVGAVAFALGHVAYFVAFCVLSKFKWTDLLAGAIIFVPVTLFITFAPIFDFGKPVFQIVCVFYAIIIACMTGKSVVNLIKQKNLLNILLVVGSTLFCASDFLLLINIFATNSSIVFGAICMLTYYPAQCVLAHSIMYSPKNNEILEKNKLFCKDSESELEM